MSSGFITARDGCRIAWRSDGPAEAPVLLLSNSLGTSMDLWAPQIAAFVSHFRVLRYDSRGHGRSDVPIGAYSLDMLGRDVVDLLDALGIERVHFCGISKGGMVGQWLGVFAAQRIGRLVLSNTASLIGTPPAWQKRILDTQLGGMGLIADGILQRWFTPSFLQSSRDIVETVLSRLLATDPAGYAGCCAAIRDADFRPIVSLITQPTLIVCGQHDIATTSVEASELAARISGSALVQLDASHLSNVECPTGFNESVLAFLQRH
jgi:3-oxoadipate enol-lactonase